MVDAIHRKDCLRRACELGERVLKELHDIQEGGLADGKPLTLQQCVSSPLQPFWVSECHHHLLESTPHEPSLLFYRVKKTACFAGVSRGWGFLISRLPTPHPTLIHWSAPCFVSIGLTSLGLSFGQRTISSFTACMTRDIKQQLSSTGSVKELGFEIALSFGGGLQDRAELLGGSCAGGMVGTVGVNRTRGVLVDISFAGGSLRVDTARNAEVYGADIQAGSILEGKVDVPSEMQPLYSAINSIVNVVERISCPSRVSASLERLTAGYDPERRMVLDSGAVIKEEGADPSNHGGRAPSVSAPSAISSARAVEGSSFSGSPAPASAAGSQATSSVAAGGAAAAAAGGAAQQGSAAQLDHLTDEQLEAELERRRASRSVAGPS